MTAPLSTLRARHLEPPVRPSMRELFVDALLADRAGDKLTARRKVDEMQRRLRRAQEAMRP